jgi:hypothetical protein
MSSDSRSGDGCEQRRLQLDAQPPPLADFVVIASRGRSPGPHFRFIERETLHAEIIHHSEGSTRAEGCACSSRALHLAELGRKRRGGSTPYPRQERERPGRGGRSVRHLQVADAALVRPEQQGRDFHASGRKERWPEKDFFICSLQRLQSSFESSADPTWVAKLALAPRERGRMALCCTSKSPELLTRAILPGGL